MRCSVDAAYWLRARVAPVLLLRVVPWKAVLTGPAGGLLWAELLGLPQASGSIRDCCLVDEPQLGWSPLVPWRWAKTEATQATHLG